MLNPGSALSARERLFCATLLLLILMPFIVWAILLNEYGVNVYRVDQWLTPFIAIRDVFSGEASLELFYQQHNEARKVFPTLISTGVAILIGHWDTRTELLLGFVLCLFLVIALALNLRKTPGFSSWRWLFGTSIFSMLLWSPQTWYFHSYSISFERLLPELAILLGILLFLGRSGIWPQVAAFSVLALVSQFSFPGGIMAWPLFLLLLVYSAFHAGRPAWLAVLCFLCVFILSVALYFQGYARPDQMTPFADVVDHALMDVGIFFLTVLGRPFASGYWPGAAIGLVSLLLFIGAIACYIRNTGVHKGLTAWVVVGLYSIVQAALITAGRLPMSMDHATRPDYALHGVYVVIATIVILGMIDYEAGRRRMAGAVIATAFFGGVLLASTTESPASRLQNQFFELQQGKACIQLFPVLNARECPHEVYPWPGQMPERILAAGSLGIMQPGLIHEIVPTRDAAVYGEVAFTFQVPEGIHFTGWAAIHEQVTDAVAITGLDEKGKEVVLGVLRGGLGSDEVAGLLGERYRYSGWAGTIPLAQMLYDPIQTNCGLHAYAMDTGTNALTELPWLENSVLGWCGKL